MAGGGMAVSGLGDEFTRRTGLHASDPGTWRGQIDFALDEARKGGWGPWHGWKGLPYAGISSGAGQAAAAGSVTNSRSSSSSSSVTIQQQNITLPGVADAAGFARDIRPAMERTQFVGAFNSVNN